mgnify:CR=1 FL=1
MFNISKIQIESNSQQKGRNNNNISVVFNISKIQIESNSQPYGRAYVNERSCVQYLKDTNWKQFTTTNESKIAKFMLCSISQRYKLKAIHNLLNIVVLLSTVVFNISKIQIESNSQQTTATSFVYDSCVQYLKDTNWKQFTTH